MKFAHIADCHLGCWRQPEMQQLNLKAFERTIDRCISEPVEFVLLVGDLFDTALPSIDILKTTAFKLKQLKDKGISCYIIHGSHDFSASGKSMIAVLEKAGLCEDVADRFVETDKAIFYGLAGKKGSLEQKEIIEQKNKISEKIKQIKKDKTAILLAHTTISELTNLPHQVASISVDDLPSGFDYYALGHVHQQNISENGRIAYAGALFPANFSELEKQKESMFFIIDAGEAKQNIKQISEPIKSVLNIEIDANGETSSSLKEKILAGFEKNKNQLKDAVVTLRIAGELENGRPSAVDFHFIEQQAKQLGIYCLLRNTNKLTSKEFELKIDEAGGKEHFNIKELEQLSLKAAIKENIVSEENKQLIESLLKHFALEKVEGETSATFTERLTKDIVKTLCLEEIWAG